MSKGWFKIWRALCKDKVWTALTETQRGALLPIIGSACYEETDWACWRCGEKRRLLPGMIHFGYRRIAEEWGSERGNIERTITKLVKLGFLVRDTAPRCHTIYIIKNWDNFQGDTSETRQGHVRDTSGTRQGHVRDTSVSIYKEVKNIRNKEVKNHNQTLLTEIDLLPTESVAAADHLYRLILKANPKHKLSRLQWESSGERLRWAQDMEKAARIDGRSWGDIKTVTEWALDNTFWAPVIQSGKKLRDKFDTIMGQMQRARVSVDTPLPPLDHPDWKDSFASDGADEAYNDADIPF